MQEADAFVLKTAKLWELEAAAKLAIGGGH
jgi:hypothetical protein